MSPDVSRWVVFQSGKARATFPETLPGAGRSPGSRVVVFSGLPNVILGRLAKRKSLFEDGEVHRAILGVPYDPQARCPRFDRAMTGVFWLVRRSKGRAAQMVRHFNEIMGYAIQPRRDIPSWFLLIGYIC